MNDGMEHLCIHYCTSKQYTKLNNLIGKDGYINNKILIHKIFNKCCIINNIEAIKWLQYKFNIDLSYDSYSAYLNAITYCHNDLVMMLLLSNCTDKNKLCNAIVRHYISTNNEISENILKIITNNYDQSFTDIIVPLLIYLIKKEKYSNMSVLFNNFNDLR